MFFLSESHLNISKADVIRRKLGFDFMEVDVNNGRARGLVLFWNSNYKVVVQYVTANYIDVVFMCNDQAHWRLTGFYGEPAWEDRHLSWDCLRDLHGLANLPWVVMEDFNEIQFGHEKDGGNDRPATLCKLSEIVSVHVILRIWVLLVTNSLGAGVPLGWTAPFVILPGWTSFLMQVSGMVSTVVQIIDQSFLTPSSMKLTCCNLWRDSSILKPAG